MRYLELEVPICSMVYDNGLTTPQSDLDKGRRASFRSFETSSVEHTHSRVPHMTKRITHTVDEKEWLHNICAASGAQK